MRKRQPSISKESLFGYTKGTINISTFHNFYRHWNNIKTLWQLEDEGGNIVFGFRDLDRVGVNHFKKLYREEERASIAPMMELLAHYPSFVSEEHDMSLKEEVTMV